MKKIYCFILILLLSSNVIAQSSNEIPESKENTTTLFEYGQPLMTIEANFKNLFENFPALVSNSGEGLKLISYKNLTAIKDEKQIRLYIAKNMGVYQSGGDILSVFGRNDVENNQIKLVFPTKQPIEQTKDEVSLKETNDHIENMVKNIHIGDEVYMVNFFANGTKYDFYMFVNPETKVVLKEGNFLAFNIPRYYADFFSKRK